MSDVARSLTLGLVVVLGAVACTNPDRPSVQAQTVAVPTPLRSPGAALVSTIERLGVALAAAPSRLVEPGGPYRPSEPQSLLQTPRVVKRADLADPDDGFVVIYGLADASAARQGAQDMVSHLESGFGQTNYPADAQFSVAIVGDTMVFTWWSRGRSSDPQKAEAAFDALSTVGERMEIVK